ncbi:MAG: hypothetical protein NZ581_04290 [Candidatus Caldarchaeum sp.]|nr:hypothetical protein [Candidatus Caldarchaeum sp.]MDW8435399.1 hypothetical protein [Candidatus Caldarchaeum sp.]
MVEFPRQTACFDFDPRQREKIYHVEANSRDVRLFVLGLGDQGVIFRHSTWVRCVRVGLDGSLYFSEATGAGGDGKIYRIAGERAELFYEVKLTQMHGFWAGHFDFDERGTLYLSNGNSVPSNVYVVENQVPRIITAFDNSVVGIRYVEQITVRAEGTTVNVAKGLFFTDNSSSLYLFDLNSGKAYKIYENTSFNWLSDVGLR